MPYISDEEFDRFKELMEKERQRLENREQYVTKIREKVERWSEEFTKYTSIEAYAVVFVKNIKRVLRHNKTKVMWFSWKRLRRYMTDSVVNYNGEQANIKKSFRAHCREYGVHFRLNRKWDTVRIWADWL